MVTAWWWGWVILPSAAGIFTAGLLTGFFVASLISVPPEEREVEDLIESGRICGCRWDSVLHVFDRESVMNCPKHGKVFRAMFPLPTPSFLVRHQVEEILPADL